ncbi:FAD dependent oxidoreductase [Annulohypoxylon truncatum]|uniref:FAD dependent oxidoreductase n=1 Tax=Annulohypoxylon truncatum TaxID=327061 RepID=UPI002008013C|nr:FAD dependent oxidoreductase [Annulohypoxylon truncatum]KAI1207906.1 FAD dependent oxidoreductase [Annulohypoxylon truncatum]
MTHNGRVISLPEGKEGNPAIKLSVASEPLIKPGTLPRILVIGGGVSGLMTAWILLDKGYRVTVISKEWAWTKDFQRSRLTSQIAGALWEYPPGGCGLTEIESPGGGWATIHHYREWSLESYDFYKQLDSLLSGRLRTEFGVAIKKLNQFFYHDLTAPNEANTEDIEKLEALRADSDRVSNLQEQKNKEDLAPLFDNIRVPKEWRKKLKYGYTHDAPIINTDKAMVYLMALVESKGAELETKELEGKLQDQGSDLLEEYKAQAIINATGLGAKELVGDTDVYPVRGAIKRISNDNTNRFEAMNEAYLVPAQVGDDKEPTKVVFLVPRNDETLIVGSIIQRNSHQLNLQENSPDVEVMWDRACSFMPGLDDAPTVPWYPLAQGLRPFTKKNVKVRADDIQVKPLIHNYGHGGSGWTLAVGCARSAVNLLELMLSGMSAVEANATLYPV